MTIKARGLAVESVDCSQILTHLIRQDNGRRSDHDARQILSKILGLTEGSPLLKACETGYFHHQTTKVFSPFSSGYNTPSNVKAVCFTESTLQGLKAHNKIYEAKYGISFKRDILYEKGANPVINIRADLLEKEVGCAVKSYSKWEKLKNHIPDALTPYVNTISATFNATQEREWRYAGDLNFNINDIFIIFIDVETTLFI